MQKSNAEVPTTAKLRQMNEQQRNQIIRMAWEDRTTFDEIREKTGATEAEVIKLMRHELKLSSFRMWRKRVSGRVTKHRKIFQENQSEARRGTVEIPDV